MAFSVSPSSPGWMSWASTSPTGSLVNPTLMEASDAIFAAAVSRASPREGVGVGVAGVS